MTTRQPDLGFVHRFVPGSAPDKPPLLLLHGTGGNEDDLIALGERVAPGAALLSPRGQVLEAGMPRFFRRVADGVFDVDDLNRRTDDLAVFLDKVRAAYTPAKPIALGFSNGANIAWSLLLRHPAALAGAVLLRPMLPFEPPAPPDLSAVPVLMLAGAHDPMVSPGGHRRLAELLKSAGADVSYQVLPAGHGLTPDDVVIASRWLAVRHVV
jgi:phospholipase/carboxylesterase